MMWVMEFGNTDGKPKKKWKVQDSLHCFSSAFLGEDDEDEESTLFMVKC